MDEFADLEARVGDMLARLDAGARRKLARTIGMDIRRSQIARVRAQRNPDGTGFEPRKERAFRARRGRLRGKRSGSMFRKLATARRFRVRPSTDGVQVGFAQNATGRIAWVHQLGLRDRVTRQPGSPTAQYPSRRLLGMTPDDRGRILDRILEALQK